MSLFLKYTSNKALDPDTFGAVVCVELRKSLHLSMTDFIHWELEGEAKNAPSGLPLTEALHGPDPKMVIGAKGIVSQST